MTENQILTRLNAEIEAQTPDVLDAVLKKCDHNEGEIIKMEARKPARRGIKSLVSIAAALALVIAGGFGYGHANAEKCVVGLDVNPGLEMVVNNLERVVSAEATNEDGELILENLDLEGLKLEDAMDIAVKELIERGYITEEANSLLLTIKGLEGDDADAMKKALGEAVNKAMADSGIEAALATQDFTKAGETAAAIAREFGVSEGRATLIEEISAALSGVEAGDLSELNINELLLLAQSSPETADKIDINIEGVAMGDLETLAAAVTDAVNGTDDQAKADRILNAIGDSAEKILEGDVTGVIDTIRDVEYQNDLAEAQKAADYIGEDTKVSANLGDKIDAVGSLEENEKGEPVVNIDIGAGSMTGQIKINTVTGEIEY